MVNTFRDAQSHYPCITCGKAIEGIPMDKGDFMFIYMEHDHPHPVQPKETKAEVAEVAGE